METVVALITRGFEQQFDYNVLEAVKPFGTDHHAHLKQMAAKLTSKNDYEFSFAVKGVGSHWEMLLSSIPSARRDFAGSPLRTYLWLSGDSADKDFAADALAAALIEVSPQEYLGESGPLSVALDEVLTPAIVDGLAKRGKEASINPIDWGVKKLIPHIRKKTQHALSTSKQTLIPISVMETAKRLFDGETGYITGEFSPFLDDPMKDDPNMTYHFQNGKILRVDKNGNVEDVAPQRRSSPRPIPPGPTLQMPRPGRRILLKIIGIIVLIIAILGIRSCVKDENKESRNLKETKENAEIIPEATNAMKIVRPTAPTAENMK